MALTQQTKATHLLPEKRDVMAFADIFYVVLTFFKAVILLQYALYIPGLAIGLKIPLILLDKYLTKIRSGWERNNKWSTTTATAARGARADHASVKNNGQVNEGMEMA